jgi:uncharacterized protein (TIGR02597 family)
MMGIRLPVACNWLATPLSPMIRPIKLLAALAALPLATLAQSVSTDPIGFVTLTTLSNSDTIFSTPLARPEAFRGSVSTLSPTTITAAGTPGWTASAFVYAAGTQSNTYYLRFRTGAKAGSYYTVTANTTDTVTIDLAGDLLTGVASGDEFALIPYWTLGTVFPSSTVGTAFEASSAFVRNTQIFFPNQSGIGTNLASDSSYYFLNSAWRQAGQPSSISYNDKVLPPDSYVTVRNKSFTGKVAVMGGVVTAAQSTPINFYAASAQDNFVALAYPVDTTLNNLGISSTFVPSTAFSRKDQVLVFDNAAAAINKSPSAIYFFMNGAWRKAGQSSSLDFGSDVIKAGSGFIVRKAVNSSGPSTVDWVFTP